MVADQQVKIGNFASFSDLVRTAIRKMLNEQKYDEWFEEAKREKRAGKGVILRTGEDIKNFVNSL